MLCPVHRTDCLAEPARQRMPGPMTCGHNDGARSPSPGATKARRTWHIGTASARLATWTSDRRQYVNGPRRSGAGRVDMLQPTVSEGGPARRANGARDRAKTRCPVRVGQEG